MNIFNINVADALQVWDSVKDSVKASIAVTKTRDTSGLDYSFITPTLLALGKFPEHKIDELSKVLQGNPVLIWNLSGKSLSFEGKAKLKNQILDAPWVTPGQFTQAPSLDCIFALCYSIKSWLDLRSDHVAIVHCSNGRSRSGILIACLLKYIGAFEHAAHAFDFFCSARVLSEAKPTLAPSYRILFENVDKTVDSGGYPNRHPIHLKCLAISGLPVDEIPCVEVWDMHGLVFNSHAGWKSTNKCTWSSEYGDGFFRVSHDILGDFSVMCRFGGHHALTRDKTTLIFKYQNNTAFLPCEVVELKRHNVDINPEYSDSLDAELFTVHLMFEKPTAATAAAAAAEGGGGAVEFGRANSVLPIYASPVTGKASFERGLDEITKYHEVQPNQNKSSALVDMGFPDHYIPVSLQLANNSMDQAAELILRMKGRAADLDAVSAGGGGGGGNSRLLTSSSFASGLGASMLLPTGSGSGSGPPFPFSAAGATQSSKHGLAGYDANHNILPRSSSDPALSPSDEGGGGGGDRFSSVYTSSSSTADFLSDGSSSSSANRGLVFDADSTICLLCSSDDILKRDQLIPCNGCDRHYHASCLGFRRIPFSLKSPKERVNRDKYILKHYGLWMCQDCVMELENRVSSPTHTDDDSYPNHNHTSSSSPFSSSTPANNAGGGTSRSPFNNNNNISSPAMGTGVGIAAAGARSSGVGGQGHPHPHPASDASSPAGAGVASGSLSDSHSSSNSHNLQSHPHPRVSPRVSPLPSQAQSKHDQAAALVGLLAASGLTMDALIAMGEEKQREAVMAAATIHNSSRQDDIISGESGINGISSIAGSSSSSGSGGLPLGMSAGGNGSATSPRGRAAGLFGSEGSPGTAAAAAAAGGISDSSSPSSAAVDPRKAMLAMIAKRSAAAAAAGESSSSSSSNGGGGGGGGGGGSASGGSGSGSGNGRGNGTGSGSAGGSGGSGSGSGNGTGTGSGIGGSESGAIEGGGGGGGGATPAATMKLRDDPKFAKYLKMIKVGLPKASVAHKMFSEGVVSSADRGMEILNMDPDGPTAAISDKAAAADKNAADDSGSEKVPVKDHPTYAKYFKMLKVGLPKEAVKAKMQQEGVNSAYIDMDPMELVPRDESKAAAADGDAAAASSPSGSVPVNEHPQYAKYFRMLKVGLPKEAIKAKMQQEGANPSYLDKDPTELIPVDESGAKVPVGEHPQYTKYFKMLKVGLPKEAIKAKMQQEGVNPSYLDKDPSELVPLSDSKAGDSGKAPAAAGGGGVGFAAAALAAAVKSKIPKVRKKKLYWKAVDASKVGSDSLWAKDDDEDIALDEAEFKQLFVETDEPANGKAGAKPDAQAAAGEKKKRINLVDPKRGQNAGIALARIKMSFEEVRNRVSNMDDEAFTTDQLRSLEEYLPNSEEATLIKSFRGDADMLGQAEKYMKVMLDFSSAPKRIQAMIYKQQFKIRIAECTAILTVIENACDDVKMSVRLKKVLKTILKVGNQMNDGEEHLGFSLDVLLKLSSAKAFDKKTTILQYVIMLIYRNDERCLFFPDDLRNCAESSRLTLDSAQQERVNLRQGWEASDAVVAEIRAEDTAKNAPNSSAAMSNFLAKARATLDDLDTKFESVKIKFASVLAYFGEEPTMSSQDLFTTLTKFIQEFIVTRDNLEKVRRLEAKRAAREQEAKRKAVAAAAAGGSAVDKSSSVTHRRAVTQITT